MIKNAQNVQEKKGSKFEDLQNSGLYLVNKNGYKNNLANDNQTFIESPEPQYFKNFV